MKPMQEAQEAAAKNHIRWRKVFIAALIAASVFLLVPRGLPWMSSGISETIMGRSFAPSWEFQASQLIVGGLHLILGMLYGLILVPLVYCFNIRPALMVGLLAGAGLYVMNYILFNYVIGNPQTDELAPLVTHLLFSVIFTAAYKAMSVPTPARMIKQTA